MSENQKNDWGLKWVDEYYPDRPAITPDNPMLDATIKSVSQRKQLR